jgi:hypothetical protein
MNLNEVLIQLKCAGFSVDEHFVQEPIALQCGHCVCKKCISTTTLKCSQCGKTTERDLRNDNESITTKMLFKMCLSSLFSEIEKQTNEGVVKLKSLLKNYQL